MKHLLRLSLVSVLLLTACMQQTGTTAGGSASSASKSSRASSAASVSAARMSAPSFPRSSSSSSAVSAAPAAASSSLSSWDAEIVTKGGTVMEEEEEDEEDEDIDAPAAMNSVNVTVSVQGNAFVPSVIRAKQGERLVVRFLGGAIDYTVSIPAFAAEVTVPANKAIDVVVPTDKTGSFTFIHLSKEGPRGTIVIE